MEESAGFERQVAASPKAALKRVAAVAEDWDASWTADAYGGGRLRLPVVAGLRHGWVDGAVRAESAGGGTRLSLRVEDSAYVLDRAAVLVLGIAGLAALVSMVAPFFAELLVLLPIGLVLMMAAWLFVVARLRNSGPEEFLAAIAEGFDETG